MPEYCPVLRPTYEEFIHVKEYIKKIEPLVTKHGICKIIPPPSWNPRHSAQCISGPGNFMNACKRKNKLSSSPLSTSSNNNIENEAKIKYDTNRFGTDKAADKYLKSSNNNTMECLCSFNDIFGDDITDSVFNIHSSHSDCCPFHTNQYLDNKNKKNRKMDDVSSIGSDDSEDDDIVKVKKEIKTENVANNKSEITLKNGILQNEKNKIKSIKNERKTTNININKDDEIDIKQDIKDIKQSNSSFKSMSNISSSSLGSLIKSEKIKYPDSFNQLLDSLDFETYHRHSIKNNINYDDQRYLSVSIKDIGNYVHVFLPYDNLFYKGKIINVNIKINSCDIKLVHDEDIITVYLNESIVIKLNEKDDDINDKTVKGYHRNNIDNNDNDNNNDCECCCPSMIAHELPFRLKDISNITHWKDMGKIPENVINSYVSMNMTIYEDDAYFEAGKNFYDYSGEADHSNHDLTLKQKTLEDSNDKVEYLADMIIKAPIRQNLYQSPDAKGGVYHCVNVVEHERMSVRYFFEKTRKELENEIKSSKKIKEIMKWINNDEIEQHIEEIQREWIRNLTYRHPLYGADSIGSLFHPQQIWNLANLDTILNLISNDIQGVTIPYLYFGSWRSMFAWHIEDRALWAINYLHFGKPKIWFAVPPQDVHKMEQLMATNFPKDAAYCHVFTRHKSSFIAPKLLEKAGIKLYRAIQRANEIIISSPNAYHSGFNLGFNCAEAVNLAMPSWIPIGINAPHCQCGIMQSSVQFDICQLIETIKQKYPRLSADIPKLPNNYRKILKSQAHPKRNLNAFYVPPKKRQKLDQPFTNIAARKSSSVTLIDDK